MSTADDFIAKSRFKAYRWTLLILGLVHATFGVLVRFLVPEVNDPVGLRIVVVSCFALFFLLSYWPGMKTKLQYGMYICFGLMLINFVYLDYSSEVFPRAAYMELFAVITMPMFYFIKPNHYLIYAASGIGALVMGTVLGRDVQWAQQANLIIFTLISVVILYFFSRKKYQTEQELIISEKIMGAVFEQSASSLFLADPISRKVLISNVKAKENFEVKSQVELLGGEGWSLVFSGFNHGEIESIIQTVIGRGTYRQEREYVSKTGRSFDAEMVIRFVVVGEEQRMLVAITDVTKIKRRSKELEKINKAMVGRELKMVELKKRVKKLETELERTRGVKKSKIE